jgi:cytolysin (calcineurin-like family phosphatase)
MLQTATLDFQGFLRLSAGPRDMGCDMEGACMRREIFKPKAAFMGGFAVVHVTDDYLDVAFAEAVGNGGVKFTNAINKPLR